MNLASRVLTRVKRAGTGAPSLVAELLELNRSRGGSAQDEENIKMAAATAYAGACLRVG